MPTTADTLPKLLLKRAREHPDAVALREKRFGIWEPLTWKQYCQRVEALALGFAGRGLAKDDKIAIVGDNRPQWLFAELAAQSIGAVPVGLYPDSTAAELAALVEASDARLLVVEDQEQVDKALEVRDELGRIERVVYWDPRGLGRYEDGWLLPMSELVDGPSHGSGRFERAVEGTGASDVALLATTSGTTGRPKLAMLTHGNLLSMAKNLGAVDPLEPEDELVSFLPLAWVGEQMMAVSTALVSGATVNFPEEPETATEDLRAIAPHAVFSPPRIWEGLVSEVQMKREDASWVKRRVLDWSLRPRTSRAKRLLAEALCCYWIKDAIGLRRLKRAYTGGAPLGPETLRFFHTLGVNLKQIYGQTEVSGISVVHRDGDVSADTMGLPIPETEIRIAEDGEILTRSPAVFAGYYKNEDATRETLRDGWLHSGDAGYLDENDHLVVIDRSKDVRRLPDGTLFSPQYVENKLKFSPYIREAVVFGGEGQPFVAALLALDFANVGTWAERRQIAFTTFTDLSQHAPVLELLRDEVARINESLSEAMRVHRFVSLHKELDADDAELTRTRKVRRGFVAERYRDLVTALYGESDRVPVQTEIAYQDGSKKAVSVELTVVAL